MLELLIIVGILYAVFHRRPFMGGFMGGPFMGGMHHMHHRPPMGGGFGPMGGMHHGPMGGGRGHGPMGGGGMFSWF